eukprot:Skav208061  [mRNA]  locus=scaffold1778:52919:53926:+ [translate_table: standard]
MDKMMQCKSADDVVVLVNEKVHLLKQKFDREYEKDASSFECKVALDDLVRMKALHTKLMAMNTLPDFCPEKRIAIYLGENCECRFYLNVIGKDAENVITVHYRKNFHTGSDLFRVLSENFMLDMELFKVKWSTDEGSSYLTSYDMISSYLENEQTVYLHTQVKAGGKQKGQDIRKQSKQKKASEFMKMLLSKNLTRYQDDAQHTALLDVLNAFSSDVQKDAKGAIEKHLKGMELQELQALQSGIDDLKDGGNNDSKVKELAVAFFGCRAAAVKEKMNNYKATVESMENLLLFGYNSAGSTSNFKLADFISMVSEQRFRKLGVENVPNTGGDVAMM